MDPEGPAQPPSDPGTKKPASASVDAAFADLYPHLRRLAASWLQGQQRGQATLQPTVLVHEAYVKLAQSPSARDLSKSHYFNLAAKAMRQILVDHARQRNAAKRGGGRAGIDITLAGVQARQEARVLDVLMLDEALNALSALNPRHAHIVELRCFAGLTLEEIAGLMGVSPRTMDAEWAAIRAWLRVKMKEA